jgi:hypothetical protein
MNTLRLGISMNQGDDFSVIITISNASGPINLTGYEFEGEMKIDTALTTDAVAEFNFTLQAQSGATLGQVLWSLPNAETAALVTSISDAERKQRLTTPYVFDVKMKDTLDTVSRLIEGIIYVSPEVTAEAFS